MVLVTFRTVQKKIYKKEFLPESTIHDAKEYIAQEQCEGQSSDIKMIFKAKTLDNDVTIGSLNIGEKDFILVHAQKPSISKTIQQANLPEAKPLPTESKAQDVHVSSSLKTGNISNPQRASASANADETNTLEFQHKVDSLMELGFPKEDCEAALRAAHGNSHVAAEYLLSGNIPMHDENENDQDLIVSIGLMAASLLIEPRILENFIEAIEVTQPTIRQNPEEILERFGNLPQDRFDLDGIRNHTAQPLPTNEFQQVVAFAAQLLNLTGTAQIQRQHRGQQDFLPEGQLPEQANPVTDEERRSSSNRAEDILATLPQDDQDAIQRLQQLGNFPLIKVIQTYLACDKNENYAANILFNNLQ